MATLSFDELNNYAVVWFSKMEVTEEAKRKRIALAVDYAEIMIMFFEMIISGKINRDNAKPFLKERLKVVADREVGTDNTAYINDWSDKEADNIIKTTFDNLDKQQEAEKNAESGSEQSTEGMLHFEEYGVDIPKEEYYTSDFRGLLIGVECATSVENYYEMFDAVRHGCTKKVWLSEADNRVRFTHTEAHGQEKPIGQPFEVGNSLLLFPGDLTYNPEEKEIANCRCHCMYY